MVSAKDDAYYKPCFSGLNRNKCLVQNLLKVLGIYLEELFIRIPVFLYQEPVQFVFISIVKCLQAIQVGQPVGFSYYQRRITVAYQHYVNQQPSCPAIPILKGMYL